MRSFEYGKNQEKLDYVLTEEEYNRGVRRLKIASCLQYFLPGIPTVYYGDEIGMQGKAMEINAKKRNKKEQEFSSRSLFFCHKLFCIFEYEVVVFNT